MSEVIAPGGLRHQRHIQFREGLGVHAFLDECHRLGKPFLRQFKNQLVVDLQKRFQPRPVREARNQPAEGQLENVRRRSLDRGVQRTALPEGFTAPILGADARQIAATPEEGLGILAFRPGGLGLFLPARQIRIARLEVRNDLLAIVQRFVQARLKF